LRPLAFVFTAFALTTAASAQEPIAAPVRAVIERSHTPTVDHSLVTTIRATVYGVTSQHMTAEFHRGSMQRVETAESRVIANCATGDRIVYYMLDDRIERSRRAGGACGIGNPEAVISSRMLPRVTGPWGPADVIELTGPDFVRRYAVTEGGILLSTDYVPRRADVGLEMETLRAQVTWGTPDAAMFEESSLRRAFAGPLDEGAAPSP
jgi:hypothetical protein